MKTYILHYLLFGANIRFCKKTGPSVICREALIRCLEHYLPRIYCLHIASRRGVTKESLNRHLSSFLGLSF